VVHAGQRSGPGRGKKGGNDDDAVDGWTMLTHAVHPGIATAHAGGDPTRSVCASPGDRTEAGGCVTPLRHAIDALLVLDAPSRVTPRRAGSTAGRRDSDSG